MYITQDSEKELYNYSAVVTFDVKMPHLMLFAAVQFFLLNSKADFLGLYQVPFVLMYVDLYIEMFAAE